MYYNYTLTIRGCNRGGCDKQKKKSINTLWVILAKYFFFQLRQMIYYVFVYFD